MRARSEKTSIKPTSKGWKTGVSSLTLVLYGMLFNDSVLVGLSLLVGLFFCIQYLRLRSILGNLDNCLEINPNRIHETQKAGDIYSSNIQVRKDFENPVRFSCANRYLRIKSSNSSKGITSVELIHSPQLSGVYTTETITAMIQDETKLFNGCRETPFETEFRVYQRVFPVAAELADYLYGNGALGEGVQSSMFSGAGFEYAESREYTTGDPLKSMDWKATARLMKPIVKTHYIERGNIPKIICDLAAPDPVSKDELAEAFLQVINMYKTRNNLDLLVTNGTNVLYNSAGLSANNSLVIALQLVLSENITEFVEYYCVLEPERVFFVSDALLKKNVLSSESSGSSFAFDIKDFLVVSSLLSDPSSIFSLLQINGCMTIFQPTKPWLFAESLDESILLWSYCVRMQRVFSGAGVRIVDALDEVYINNIV